MQKLSSAASLLETNTLSAPDFLFYILSQLSSFLCCGNFSIPCDKITSVQCCQDIKLWCCYLR